jgi:hypothetical protein
MRKLELIIEPGVFVPQRISLVTAHEVNDALLAIERGGSAELKGDGLVASLLVRELQVLRIAFVLEWGDADKITVRAKV